MLYVAERFKNLAHQYGYQRGYHSSMSPLIYGLRDTYDKQVSHYMELFPYPIGTDYFTAWRKYGSYDDFRRGYEEGYEEKRNESLSNNNGDSLSPFTKEKNHEHSNN